MTNAGESAAAAGAAPEPAWAGEVLHFWFEELGQACWFAKSPELDTRIRARFLALYEQLAARDNPGFNTPRLLLAAVIVLDQFSRNMFRNTPQAYAADPIARRLSREAIRQGYDATLREPERLFLYMPLEHSEDRADQALAVELLSRLGKKEWTQSALAHKVIIDRFGRFPHRNAILGRESSPAELELLQDPMGSF